MSPFDAVRQFRGLRELRVIPLLLLFPGSNLAWSACLPVAPVQGDIVTCSGAQTSGITLEVPNLIVNVEPTATIIPGAFSGFEAVAITGSPGGLTFNNFGVIHVLDNDLWAVIIKTGAPGGQPLITLNNANEISMESTTGQAVGITIFQSLDFRPNIDINNSAGALISANSATGSAIAIQQNFSVDPSANPTLFNVNNDGAIRATGVAGTGILAGEGAAGTEFGITITNGSAGAAAVISGSTASLQLGNSTSTSAISILNGPQARLEGALLLDGAGTIALDNRGTIDGPLQVLGTASGQYQNTGVMTGPVELGPNQDTFNMQAGAVQAALDTASGDDTLLWSAGALASATLGEGNDQATLSRLAQSDFASSTLLDGGLGSDNLVLDHSTLVFNGTVQGWENISLSNASDLTLAAPMVMGDAQSGTGALTIDASSVLRPIGESQASIESFAPSSLVSVINAGTIDLRQSNQSVGSDLTIVGNYQGQNGQVAINTVLAGDGSPSDRLVIDGGAATGFTRLLIQNVSGEGAQTQNGIQVLEARNGASVTPGAFTLNERVLAGAYEYMLFRGDGGLYLRSTLLPGEPAPEPELPPGEPRGGSPISPPPSGGDSVPIFRQEIPLYLSVPLLTRDLDQRMLGTFHQRQGEQQFLSNNTSLSAGWGRVFGGHDEQNWSGGGTAEFDGQQRGFQVGSDLWAAAANNGGSQHVGVFFGAAQSEGNVSGLARGVPQLSSGNMDLDSKSVGAYWTGIGRSGDYLDAVVMASSYDATPHADTGQKIDVSGKGALLSLEAGHPFYLTPTTTLEPQLQLIYQRQRFDSAHDDISSVDIQDNDSVTSRAGVRLTHLHQTPSANRINAFVGANVWHVQASDDEVEFGSDRLGMDPNATTLEVTTGVAATLSDRVQLFARASRFQNLDSEHQESLQGTIGVRVQW